MTALLAGCGGGGGSSGGSDTGSAAAPSTSASAADTVRVTGGAVKGVIQQGIVTAHRLVADQNGRYRADEAVSEAVRTNSRGGFTLDLDGAANGWALVELSADDQTRMKCDVVPQCVIDGAESVPFGETFALDEGFTLRGAVDLAKGEVYLTPLSHLAVGLAERRNNLSGTGLGSAYSEVEDLFALAEGSLQQAPPDLTDLYGGGVLNGNSLHMAVVNASFLAMVNDNEDWNHISEVLETMMAQVTTQGGLDIAQAELSLSELVLTSAEQSRALQEHYKRVPDLRDALGHVAVHNMDFAEAIVAASEAEQEIDFDGDLADVGTFQPGSGGFTGGIDSGSGNSSGNGTGSSDAIAGRVVAGNEADTIVVGSNQALLSWDAPWQRENGDKLFVGEIKGFEIRYGRSPTSLELGESLGAEASHYLLSELDSGTWYFQIRTLDTEGNASRWSASASKTI